MRKHWWRIGLMGVVICGLALAARLTVPNVDVPLWFVIPMTCFAVLGTMWDQIAGTYHLVSGRDAEKWTSKELRKVMGPGWHVVDGISFAFHDVDHVVVGPGGVYAIETKYTDSTIDFATINGRQRSDRWVEQAEEGARSVRFLLWDNNVDVYPGVVVWGGHITGGPYFRDGVPVLRPTDLEQHFAPWHRDIHVLSEPQVDAIVRALRGYRDKRLRHEREKPAAQAA